MLKNLCFAFNVCWFLRFPVHSIYIETPMWNIVTYFAAHANFLWGLRSCLDGLSVWWESLQIFSRSSSCSSIYVAWRNFGVSGHKSVLTVPNTSTNSLLLIIFCSYVVHTTGNDDRTQNLLDSPLVHTCRLNCCTKRSAQYVFGGNRATFSLQTTNLTLLLQFRIPFSSTYIRLGSRLS